MTPIVSIVEGHGEVAALPILLRRIRDWKSPDYDVLVLPPIRVQRSRFLNRDSEFNRVLGLAAAKAGSDGWILVLLDADDDCPATLASEVLTRGRAQVPHRRLSVVMANREFEAWFIASALSLHGRRGFSFDPMKSASDSEAVRDAKGWMRNRMTHGAYGETTDQPGFAAVMDLQQAHDRSRSFRKLCAEWQRIFT